MGYTAPTGHGNSFLVTRHVDAAEAVDSWVFIAPGKCKLIGIREVHAVVGGSGALFRPRKITANAVAPGASAGTTVIELTAADVTVTSTADTVKEPALSTTKSALRFDAGDRLAENWSGTVAGLVGCVIEYRFLEL